MKVLLIKIARKFLSRLFRVSLWAATAVIGVLILLQLLFWGGVVWINSQGGQNFIQARVGDGLEGSGYHVQISKLSFLFLTELRLGGVDIYQGDHKLLSLDSIYLDVDLFPLSEKILSVNLDIQAATLHQGTKAVSNKANPAQPIQPIIVEPFDLPDLYFTRINIADISINEFVLKAGEKTVLSPTLSGYIDLNDPAVAAIHLEYSDTSPDLPASFPKMANLSATFMPQKSELKVTDITAEAQLYNLSSNAHAVFRANNDLVLNAKITPHNIADLAPISFNAVAENKVDPSLNIKAKGMYQEKDVQLSMAANVKGDLAHIKDISVRLPDLTLNGNLTANSKTSLVKGSLSGQLQRLSAYRQYVGADHVIKPLDIMVNLSHAAGQQKVDVSVKTKSYRNTALNLSVRDVALQASLLGDVATIDSLTMRDADQGTMSASGFYNLSTQSVDVSCVIKDLNAIKGDIANGSLSADISFKGTPDAYILDGKISPNKIEIKLPEKFSSSIPQLNVVKKKAPKKPDGPDMLNAIALNVVVDAPRQILVRGWGLDAEFGGQLDVKGKASDPQFIGELDVVRGRYKEFGKTFKLAKAQLQFGGSIPPYPKMDIVAEVDTGKVIAQVLISGSTTKPEIGFSSVPELPEDEVMANILFGDGLDNLTPFQAVQLAQTVQRFSGGGGGGFDPIGDVRSMTGLDDLKVGTSESGGATVGAGKYLTEKVYLELETGSEPGSGKANIEVELTPSITFESEIGQDAQPGGGIFWKHDY